MSESQPLYSPLRSDDKYLGRSEGAHDVWERIDASGHKIFVIKTHEGSNGVEMAKTEVRRRLGTGTITSSWERALELSNASAAARHNAQVNATTPRFEHDNSLDSFLGYFDGCDVYKRFDHHGNVQLVARSGNSSGSSLGVSKSELDYKIRVGESVSTVWRKALDSLNGLNGEGEVKAMGAGNKDPNYNPMMDDPDFRRGRQRRKKTTTTEEVVEEEYDDDEESDDDEYEDEEGDEMPEERGIGSAIGSAVVAGAKQAGAGQLNDLMASQIKKALVAGGVITQEASNNMLVEMVIKALGPMAILYAAEKFPNQVPQAKLVAQGAQLALTAATTEVIGPALMLATPMFKQLAEAAVEQKSISGNTERDDGDFEIDVTEKAS